MINEIKPVHQQTTQVRKVQEAKEQAGSLQFEKDIKTNLSPQQAQGQSDIQQVSLSNVDPLFIALSDQNAQGHMAYEHAKSILDQLELVRDGLLKDNVHVENLKKLSNIQHDYIEDQIDPRLKEIINEIEILAAVEMAKLNQKLDSTQANS